MKITNVIVIPAILALGAEAITFPQCQAACKGGTLAMQRFCRALPHPGLKAGCWALTSGLRTPRGQVLCVNWCRNFPSRRKRDLTDDMEGDDELSLAGDLESMGIDLDADIEGEDIEVPWTA
ncbi:MAG: hypothetical protein M1815_001398 [Lichina confinis]|nr:MAG: hypothetical protein M1815_001398 [Lichina confinis]